MMGTYYRIDNHTKHETIDPSSVANIKYGCMQRWSLQLATLVVFLGFDPHRSGCDLGPWVGRWNLDQIRIHNDGEDDSEADNWPDVSMEFYKYLRDHDILERWAEHVGIFPPQ